MKHSSLAYSIRTGNIDLLIFVLDGTVAKGNPFEVTTYIKRNKNPVSTIFVSDTYCNAYFWNTITFSAKLFSLFSLKVE